MQQKKHPYFKQRRLYAILIPIVLVVASFAMWLVFTLQKSERPARVLLTAFIIGVAAAAIVSGLFVARWAAQNRPRKQYHSTNKNDRLFAVLGWLLIGLLGMPVYYLYNLVAMLVGPKKSDEPEQPAPAEDPAPTAPETPLPEAAPPPETPAEAGDSK